MRATITLLALPLAACATMQSTAGLVALEQTQRLGGLRVTPMNVVEDSRCPENARCMWAGRIVVRAMIEEAHEQLERNLTPGEPAEVTGLKLMLDSAAPARNSGTELSVAA